MNAARLPLAACLLLIGALAVSSPALAKLSVSNAVRSVLAKPTAALRKAEIARVVQAGCGVTLDTQQLAAASAFLEANRAKGVSWVAEKIAESDLSAVCD